MQGVEQARLLTIIILEVETGQRVLYMPEEIQSEDVDDLILYLWEEGNFSCDCNRGLFFAQALGDMEREEQAWEGGCSEGKYRVEVRERDTARVIYTEL